MIGIISVSTRGQIVIPEDVRKHLGIKPGSKLVLLERDGTIVLKRAEDVSRHLQGTERMEEMGWLGLAEQSLRDIWDNAKDEKAWSKYL